LGRENYLNFQSSCCLTQFDCSDVGNLIITDAGLKQGASLMGLIVFPLLFPLVALLGIALFIISIFGTGVATTAGRRFDPIGNDDSFDNYIMKSTKELFKSQESQECVEWICCDMIEKASRYGNSSRIKRFALLPFISQSISSFTIFGHLTETLRRLDSCHACLRLLVLKLKLMNYSLRLLKLAHVSPHALEKIDLNLSTGSGCAAFKCTLQNFMSDVWNYTNRSELISKLLF
jgi:hypothetical protein